MNYMSNSLEKFVRKQYYQTLALAFSRRHDVEDLRMRLVSVLYDVVDIDHFRDVLEGLSECLEELTDGVVEPTLLDRYALVLKPEICSIEAFRPVCRELLEVLNRVLAVSREGRGQLKLARMHSMGIHIVK